MSSCCLVQGRATGLFASWTRVDERFRAHCRVCLVLSAIVQFSGCERTDWGCGFLCAVGCARKAVMLAMGIA
jgi:hypothetical protein